MYILYLYNKMTGAWSWPLTSIQHRGQEWMEPHFYRDRIPVASVTRNFLVDTERTMCPGVNSVSKKWVPGIPLGVKVAGSWGWRPTTLVVPNVKKSGALTYSDPLGNLDGLLWERPLPLNFYSLYIP